MNKEIYTQLTQHQQTTSTNINHATINFVDDSTNIISTTNTHEIQDYTNKFYRLLEAVYNINKLKINNDKTELLFICKPKYRTNTKNLQITASGHKVKQVNKAKILGYTLLNNLQHNKHIATITSNINNRLFNIKKITPNTTIKSRKILTKAIVIGKLNYCLPLLCNARQAQLAHLNTLITKSCQTIMGSRCPRWTNEKLLNRCQMPTIYQSINNQALNYIHRLQSTKTPPSLYTMYRIPQRPQRTNQTLKPAYEPKTKQLKASLFFKYTEVYNQLPQTLKILPKTKFKAQIKSHIQINTQFHTIPKDKGHESDNEPD